MRDCQNRASCGNPIVPGSDRTYLRWLAATYESFLPLLEQYGAVGPVVGDPFSLYRRMDAEVTARRVQGATPPYVEHSGRHSSCR